MDQNLDKAYFTHLRNRRQCELSFLLRVKHEKFGTINETTKCLRKDTHTITSLLQQTTNNIINIIKTKIANDADNDVEVNVSLTRNQVNINDNIRCLDLLHYRNKLRLVVFDRCYRVLINAPILNEIFLPVCVYAESMVGPSRFKGLYIDKKLSKFTWSKSVDKIKWTEIGSEFYYTTITDDVGYYLKIHCIPRNSYSEGPPTEAISQNAVEVIDIGEKTFPFESKHVHTKIKTSGKRIRIASYNVLAERYTLNDQFAYCDRKYLSIEYRKRLLLKEILGYNADVICFQEMDASTFHNFFKDEFNNRGYECIFNRKGNKIPEGLACIYNKSRLKQVSRVHIVLANELKNNKIFSDMWNIVKRHRDFKALFLKQQTSLQVTVLKLYKTGDVFLVANTHLYYHYEAGHIRLFQMAVALRFISMWLKKIKRNKERISVIFCGDFNSTPDSGVYRFITEGNVDNCEEELKKMGFLSITTLMEHEFNFKSACGTPQFTNYTDIFKGCLDYIFIEKDKTSIVNVLPLPGENELSEYTALPNKNFPSDHIALVANLRLKPYPAHFSICPKA